MVRFRGKDRANGEKISLLRPHLVQLTISARHSVGKQPVTLQVEIIEAFYPNVLKATDHNFVAFCKVDGVGNSKNLCCLLPGFSRSGING